MDKQVDWLAEALGRELAEYLRQLAKARAA